MIRKGSNLDCASEERRRHAAAGAPDPFPRPARDQPSRHGRLPRDAAPGSHGALPFEVQLDASFRLLARLLLREGDVGIHQASSNAAKQRRVRA